MQLKSDASLTFFAFESGTAFSVYMKYSFLGITVTAFLKISCTVFIFMYVVLLQGDKLLGNKGFLLGQRRLYCYFKTQESILLPSTFYLG